MFFIFSICFTLNTKSKIGKENAAKSTKESEKKKNNNNNKKTWQSLTLT